MILPKQKRHFTTWLALLALLFATAITPLSHSFAMASPPAMDMAGHDHQAHGMAMDEAATSRTADSHDAMPMPCEQGCSLCKNCALCSLQVLNAPASLLLFFPSAGYTAASTIGLLSHIAALPPKPPRI